eukprot:122937_1
MGSCCAGTDENYAVIPLEILELSKHQCEYELTDSCSVTFYPSPHLRDPEDHGQETLQHELFTSSSRLHNVLSEMKCTNLISCNDDDLMIIQQESKINPFIECAIRAWSNHYPLHIYPQHIWLLILQSVSIYIYSKKARNPLLKKNKSENDKIRLTPFPSQLHASKNYDYSTTGTINNKEWILKIKELLGLIETDMLCDEVTSDLLSSLRFTKATYLDELSCKFTAMNSLINSYLYDESTACGFPSITLCGKKDDWLLLRDKTVSILDKKCDKQFNRDWSECLLPILDRFVSVYDGDIDAVFWNSMIKRGAMSGSNGMVQWYSGWINCFFPIINNHDNQWCEPYSFDIGYIQSGLKNEDKYGGIEVNSFPIGLCHADAVILSDVSPEASPEEDRQSSSSGSHSVDADPNAHHENIKVVSGFIGYTQDRLSLALRPVVGWFAVADTAQNMNNNGYDQRLQGISEDDDDLVDRMDDDEDNDALRLIDKHSSKMRIKPSDEEDDSDDMELGYAQNTKKGQKFMPIQPHDEDDAIHKVMHKHLSNK